MKGKLTIDQKRVYDTFRELVAMDSESYQERQIADHLTLRLRNLGFQVSEDEAGSRIGGSAGNLYGFLKGTIPGDPILLSAHMDTVAPGKGKRALLCEDGKITSHKDTVLGADDCNGIAGILEGIRSVAESGIPHRDVEVVFSVAEEAYCEGAKLLDYGNIKAKEGYVFDLSGAPGIGSYKAPSILSFSVTVHGRASHAGFCPQEGIHAIRIMSQAIAKVPWGHLDEDTTLNIGEICGGQATNIVPENCVCRGEVRSYDHNRALAALEMVEKIFAETVKNTGASFHMEVKEHIRAYCIEQNAPVVKRFQRACDRMGIKMELTETFGGSDNNLFAAHGISGMVLSCGMNQVHSVGEYTSLEELGNCARMVAELITESVLE